MTRIERELLLQALLNLWLEDANTNLLGSRDEIERCIVWQVLALTGTYDAHAACMTALREAK